MPPLTRPGGRGGDSDRARWWVARRDGSSHRSHYPVPLSFLSQHHSTVLPFPKRYDKRYEEKFLRDIRPHQRPRGHDDPHEDVEVGHTSLLTSFSIDGEYISITCSARRGWLLRASATPPNVGYLECWE